MSRRSLFLAAMASAAILLTNLSAAYAIAGKIESADGIAFSSDYPEHAQKQIRQTLLDDSLTFTDGYFVNWISTLHFQGDTTALNKLAESLAACEGTTVRVRFTRADADFDFEVIHDAHSNDFQIRINLNSGRIELEALVLPPPKGPTPER